MRVVLRCLIAMNWVAFAVACNGYFGYLYAWSHFCFDLARDDLANDRPDLDPGTDEYHEYVFSRASEYRRRTDRIARGVAWGWGLLVGVSFTTAVGIMVVFPRLTNARPPEPDPPIEA